MKKSYELFAVLISVVITVLIGNTAAAATSSEVAAYGFTVPSSGYKYKTWFIDSRTITIYSSNGVKIGDAVTVAARARSNTTDSSGYYYDTMLIRVQMEPRITKSGGEYYRGLNYMNQAKTTLTGNRLYVNFAPKATMPESSSTWNVSFSGSGGTDKKFGFTLGTGYSSTIKENCYEVETHCYSSDKSYDISYNYKPSSNIISTAARRARNLWCANTHQAFYAFTYRTKSTNTQNVTVNYNASFRYARTSSSWNGSTYDVIIIPHHRDGSMTVTYQGSGTN